jgi:hypothetical protein
MTEPAPGLQRLNATSFTAESLPLGDPSAPQLVFIAKGTFDLEPGAVAKRSEVQEPLAGADVPVDPEAPGESAVRYESDLVPWKPLADVLCAGHAHAPAGHATAQLRVRFGVGPVRKEILVVGDRHWSSGVAGLAHFASRPEPFVSIPIHFGRAYGGSDVGKEEGLRFYDANRVGVGYSKYGFGVAGAALPNLEDPRDPIKSWRGRPAPQSFGPVGRTWQPRLARAGTTDAKWLAERAPLLPRDFDERFYNAAPDDQQVRGYLRGDEPILAHHLHALHPHFECALPGVRVRCFLDRPGDARRELFELPLALDTCFVDMDALRLVLVWRGRLAPVDVAQSRGWLLVEEKLDAPARDAASYLDDFEARLAEQSDAWAEADLAEGERSLAEATGREVPSESASND